MNHLNETKLNNQGCLMKIVEDNGSSDIVVEFQDEHRYKKHTIYANFKRGCIRNPYHPTVYGVGITGNKYKTKVNDKHTKEYIAWTDMLERCFIERAKDKQPSYKNVTCCKEWLNFELFCDWLHCQSNFDKWKNGYRWALDKDILVKGNKVYSPETCCLVPQNVNCLLLKRDALRGNLPLGVKRNRKTFSAVYSNPITGKSEHLGNYETAEEAFYAYKCKRESYIKQVAEIEYKTGNITEPCYIALMNYAIEIND